jgi:hypothetical protein
MMRIRPTWPSSRAAAAATRPAFVEVDDTQPLLRPHASQRPPVHGRAQPALRHPLLAGAEVADEPEADIVEGRPVGERQRDAPERQAPLGVQRAVDRVDDDHPGALAAEAALAQLLGDEPEVDAARMQLLQPRDDDGLGVAVDHCRVVAALALAHDRLAHVARRERGEGRADVGGHLPAEAEPVLIDG